MKIQKFEDLKIWQLSMQLTKEVYGIFSEKDFSRDFELKDQLRRAIVSVSSNIVEGFEKNNNNEFIRYLKIAKGSAGEARNHLFIALTVSYLKNEEFSRLNGLLNDLSNQVGSLISYLVKQKRLGRF